MLIDKYLTVGCNRKSNTSSLINTILVYAGGKNIIKKELNNSPDVILLDGSTITTLVSDGNYILVGDEEGRINIINFKTNKVIKTEKMNNSIQSLTIIQNKEIFIVCTIDKLCILKSNNILKHADLDEFINCMDSFSINEFNYIICGTYSGKILIYEFIEDEMCLKIKFQAHSNGISIIKLKFINEKLLLMTASQDKSIKIWEVTENQIHSSLLEPKNIVLNSKEYNISLKSTLIGHHDWIFGCSWANGLDIISGSADNSIIYWKYKDETWTSHFRFGGVIERNHAFYDVHYCSYPNEYILALSFTGGVYKYVKTEDNKHDSYELQYYVSGHQNELNSIDWAGKYVLTASSDMTCRIFHNYEEVARPQIHGYPMKVARFLKTDRFEFVSAGQETIMREYQATKKFIKSHKNELVMYEDYPESVILSELSLTNELNFDPENYKITEQTLSSLTCFFETKKVYGHFFEIEDIAVSKDMIVSTNRSSVKEFAGIFVWDSSFNKVQYLKVHDLGVLKLRFSLDGKFLGAASRDKTSSLYKVVENNGAHSLELISRLEDHKRVVWSCGFTYNSNYFLTCSRDRKVLIYDLKSLKIIQEICFEGEVTALSCSPIKNEFCIGTDSGELFLIEESRIGKWEIKFQRKIHSGKINAVEYNLEGDYLATGGSDCLLRVFKFDDLIN